MKKVILGVGMVALVAILGTVAFVAYKSPESQSLMENDPFENFNGIFDKFVERHNKIYFNEEEYKFRRNVYIKKLIDIEAHNTAGNSWNMGINRFSDLTSEEFLRMYTGYRKNEDIQVPEAEFTNIKVADSIDWKSKGAVAPVKDQGQCGSCWAFSTVAGTEGAYFLKHNTLKTFSEQQLVDCATSSYGNYGCNGGDLPGSFEYFQDYGFETESAYPYTARDGRCSYSSGSTVAKVTGYQSVRSYSDSALKQGLNQQPLAVCIDATYLQSYSGGVVDVNACGAYPSLNHCVLLYGYNGSQYWSLKNSWGSDWGENGYFRFAQGGDTCGIQEEAMTVQTQ